MIQNAYLSIPFSSDERSGQRPCHGQASMGLLERLRNRTLFNLGTILIELWFGKVIDALRPSQGEDSRVLVAWDLAKAMADDEGKPGENYTRAVWFCLAPDQGGNNSLENASFIEEVWSNVVWPLQEYLKSFSGREIEQLLL